jgi:hypothetical protein
LNVVESPSSLVGIRMLGGTDIANRSSYSGRACGLQKAATAMLHVHVGLPWVPASAGSGYLMLRAVFESLLLDGDLTIFNQFFKN